LIGSKDGHVLEFDMSSEEEVKREHNNFMRTDFPITRSLLMSLRNRDHNNTELEGQIMDVFCAMRRLERRDNSIELKLVGLAFICSMRIIREAKRW